MLGLIRIVLLFLDKEHVDRHAQASSANVGTQSFADA
jgi:hypothetical protein